MIGNKIAFNELIKKMQVNLYKIARMRLHCEDDINDAVQETIIQTYKNIHKIKHPEYFNTWIVKVLINNCNKVYKKSKNEKVVEYNEVLANKSYTINEYEKIKDLDFYILIEKLNYNERITLTLYYLLEFTTKEISQILDEPENTIKSRISRARIKIKKICEGGNSYERGRL